MTRIERYLQIEQADKFAYMAQKYNYETSITGNWRRATGADHG